MKKDMIFTGAGTALVTPFTPAGEIAWEELEKLVEFQLEGGIDAIIACGTTGEAATVTAEEHLRVVDFIIKKVNGRVPVIAGTGSNDTAFCVELSQEAKKLGADGLLLVTPYYNKTSQKGLVESFDYIADTVKMPCILYNVPSRTGCNLLPATLAELAKIPNINGVKEASGSLAQASEIAALCGDELNLYSGEDGLILPILALGGKGVISVLSNVAPQYTHDLCAAWFAGDVARCRKMQLDALPLVHALFADVNPIPVKWAMNRLGWAAGPLRLPMCDPDEGVQRQLETAMRDFGILKE